MKLNPSGNLMENKRDKRLKSTNVINCILVKLKEKKSFGKNELFKIEIKTSTFTF